MRFDNLKWVARMFCAWYYQRWISPYLDGELDPRRKGRIEHHLRQCSGCRAEYEKMLFASQMISHVGLPSEAPASILAHLGQHLSAPNTVRTERKKKLQLRWSAAVVAVVMLVSAIGVLVPRWLRPGPGTRPETSTTVKQPTPEAVTPTAVSLEKIALKVTQGGCDNTGFCCSSDKDKLMRAIQGIPGVHQCELNKERKEVVVAYEQGKVKLEDLQKATEKVGFKVALLKSPESK
mgnify:CR=1 FL=1